LPQPAASNESTSSRANTLLVLRIPMDDLLVGFL
jgi:hypothetical protein